jgi:hypothetical protein
MPRDLVQSIVVWQAGETPANAPQGLYLDPDAEAHRRYGLDGAGGIWFDRINISRLAARHSILSAFEMYSTKVLS